MTGPAQFPDSSDAFASDDLPPIRIDLPSHEYFEWVTSCMRVQWHLAKSIAEQANLDFSECFTCVTSLNETGIQALEYPLGWQAIAGLAARDWSFELAVTVH